MSEAKSITRLKGTTTVRGVIKGKPRVLPMVPRACSPLARTTVAFTHSKGGHPRFDHKINNDSSSSDSNSSLPILESLIHDDVAETMSALRSLWKSQSARIRMLPSANSKNRNSTSAFINGAKEYNENAERKGDEGGGESDFAKRRRTASGRPRGNSSKISPILHQTEDDEDNEENDNELGDEVDIETRMVLDQVRKIVKGPPNASLAHKLDLALAPQDTNSDLNPFDHKQNVFIMTTVTVKPIAAPLKKTEKKKNKKGRHPKQQPSTSTTNSGAQRSPSPGENEESLAADPSNDESPVADAAAEIEIEIDEENQEGNENQQMTEGSSQNNLAMHQSNINSQSSINNLVLSSSHSKSNSSERVEETAGNGIRWMSDYAKNWGDDVTAVNNATSQSRLMEISKSRSIEAPTARSNEGSMNHSKSIENAGEANATSMNHSKSSNIGGGELANKETTLFASSNPTLHNTHFDDEGNNNSNEEVEEEAKTVENRIYPNSAPVTRSASPDPPFYHRIIYQSITTSNSPTRMEEYDDNKRPETPFCRSVRNNPIIRKWLLTQKWLESENPNKGNNHKENGFLKRNIQNSTNGAGFEFRIQLEELKQIADLTGSLERRAFLSKKQHHHHHQQQHFFKRQKYNQYRYYPRHLDLKPKRLEVDPFLKVIETSSYVPLIDSHRELKSKKREKQPSFVVQEVANVPSHVNELGADIDVATPNNRVNQLFNQIPTINSPSVPPVTTTTVKNLVDDSMLPSNISDHTVDVLNLLHNKTGSTVPKIIQPNASAPDKLKSILIGVDASEQISSSLDQGMSSGSNPDAATAPSTTARVYRTRAEILEMKRQIFKQFTPTLKVKREPIMPLQPPIRMRKSASSSAKGGRGSPTNGNKRNSSGAQNRSRQGSGLSGHGNGSAKNGAKKEVEPGSDVLDELIAVTADAGVAISDDQEILKRVEEAILSMTTAAVEEEKVYEDPLANKTLMDFVPTGDGAAEILKASRLWRRSSVNERAAFTKLFVEARRSKLKEKGTKDVIREEEKQLIEEEEEEEEKEKSKKSNGEMGKPPVMNRFPSRGNIIAATNKSNSKLSLSNNSKSKLQLSQPYLERRVSADDTHSIQEMMSISQNLSSAQKLNSHSHGSELVIANNHSQNNLTTGNASLKSKKGQSINSKSSMNNITSKNK